MCQSTDQPRCGEAGFTLLEVLVALAVLAISLVAIGSLVATNIRTTRALDNRLTLIETARSILTGLPERQRLLSGDLAGEIAGHQWRIDVLPFAASFIDLRQATPWVPQTVVVRVQAPNGQILRIDTVRLRPGPGAAR